MEISHKKMLLEMLEKHGSCEVIVSGESMKPFIRPGDTVKIIRTGTDFLPGHAIAFFNSDQLIVHRVYGRKKLPAGNRLYKVWGDSSPDSHGVVLPESVAGRVQYILRSGKKYSVWFNHPFCALSLPFGLIFQAGVLFIGLFRTKTKNH
jgi:hypothetical protein